MNTFSTRRTASFAFALALFALVLLLVPFAALAADPLPCAVAPVAADPSATVCLSNMVVVFDGVSPDNQFVVTWRTQQAEKGQVKLSDGTTYDDARGAAFKGKTHYVVVSNVDAKTNYTFDIVSGGKTFSQNNAHWTIRTGPPLAPGAPFSIVGRVSNPDGSEADGALVYAQLRDGDKKGTAGRSTWLSALVVVPDGGNFFNLDAALARASNATQKYTFDPDGDRVLILASGEQGTAKQTFKLNELHPPAAPPSLILASDNKGSAATATPTQIPPTLTPTASPTATATVTPLSPTPSQTHTPLPASATPEPVTETAQAQATKAQADATQTAAVTETVVTENTDVAMAAGEEVEPQRTRVFGGVPNVVPPRQTNNNNLILIVLAVVLIVGAALLGLAAFFIRQSKS
ncbi:MAG: hypothetical protein HDKAJFGB_01555 [Anaerolineae bacterium]|nr:hypothetical protein [Anaerolineae bacterium]